MEKQVRLSTEEQDIIIFKDDLNDKCLKVQVKETDGSFASTLYLSKSEALFLANELINHAEKL